MCGTGAKLVTAFFMVVLMEVGSCEPSSTGVVSGADSVMDSATDPSTDPATVPFHMASVVHPRVSELGPPKMMKSMSGVQMRITSSSAKARKHVRQGFALIHAQWNFEAYRHFAAALVIDPDCLMAYAGVTMALIQPFNEYADCRGAAVLKMLDISDADKSRLAQGKAGRFSTAERGFADAVAALVSQNPQSAGDMFLQVTKDDADCIQAKLITLFLNRGGYNVANEPSQSRLDALREAQRLMDNYPDNWMVMGFWLMINAEAPFSVVDIKKEILPHARYLAKNCPDVPSWQHALGHFEWRAGNYLLAERAFRRAIKLYEEWMQDQGVGLNDCEGYVKSQCYLANTLFQRDDFTGAMKVAMHLRGLKLDSSRPRSAGNQIILWRAYHLPARLYLGTDTGANLLKALESLPPKEEIGDFVNHPVFPTLAGVYIEALAAYIGSRKAIHEQMLEDAVLMRNSTLRGLIKKLARVVDGAMMSADFTHYFNAGSSLAVYDTELAGLIAAAGDEGTRSTALNHFMSARDKQGVPSLMMPPLVLSAMENRIGDYYHSVGRHANAYEAYYQGLQRYPHNMASLVGIQQALINLGQADEARRVGQHIELVKKNNR
jgi:tetratricopeptide (TPR) repeat protein